MDEVDGVVDEDPIMAEPPSQPPVPPGTDELARVHTLRQQLATATGRFQALNVEHEYHANLLSELETERDYWAEVIGRLAASLAAAEDDLESFYENLPASP